MYATLRNERNYTVWLPLSLMVLLLLLVNAGLYRWLAPAPVVVFEPATDTQAAAERVVIATPLSQSVATRADALLDGSYSISGEWVLDDGVLSQVSMEQTDYIHTLDILAKNYRLATTISYDDPLTSSGGGLIFNMPQQDSKAGATMVRFVEGGQGVTWGFFDPSGMYNGAGYAELNLDRALPHTLAVDVRPEGYDIIVDGQVVVVAVSHSGEAGWLGLVAFRGGVAFNSVTIALVR